MSSTADNPARLLRDIRKLVELHQNFGIDTYPRSPELTLFLSTPSPLPPSTSKPPPPIAARPATKAPPTIEQGPTRSAQTLAEIQAEFGDCHRCPRHSDRQQIVFGTGNPKAALFIVGDFPTAAAEAAATPFSGESGALLAKMLKAIGLTLDDVYLASIVKCHSQDDAPLLPEQIKACLPFLLRQIDAVAPQVICAMGPLATQTLLKSKAPLIRLRGNFHDFRGTPLMPTFHPAFLLKNEEMKKATWIDLQLIQAKLGSNKGGP